MRIIVSILLASLVVLGYSEGDDDSLTLRGLLTEVEAVNLSVLAAREGVTSSVENVRRARASLLPNVKGVVGQSRNRTVTVGLGLEEFGISRQSDPYNRFNAGVESSIPLLDLTSIALYENAKHLSEIAQYEYDAAVEDIKLAASETFVSSLRAREARNLAYASLERAKSLRDIVGDRVDAGVANPIDLSRAKLEVSAARQVVISQEAAVVESDQNLKLFLNRDLDKPIDLVAFYVNGEEELPSVPTVNFGTVLEKRTDYLAGLQQEDRAQLLVRAAGWQRLPSVDAFGNYGYVTETAFDGDEEANWSVGIALSVPIFEGFKTKAEKEMARSELRASERRLQETEKRIGTEVRITWERLRAAQSRYVVGVENLDLAQETFRLAMDRFKNGVVDNRELIETQLGLDKAETDLLDLRLLHVVARLQYARVCGAVETVFEGLL